MPSVDGQDKRPSRTILRNCYKALIGFIKR